MWLRKWSSLTLGINSGAEWESSLLSSNILYLFKLCSLGSFFFFLFFFKKRIWVDEITSKLPQNCGRFNFAITMKDFWDESRLLTLLLPLSSVNWIFMVRRHLIREWESALHLFIIIICKWVINKFDRFNLVCCLWCLNKTGSKFS